MNPDQLALWQRIEAHRLDDPAATLPFTLRLAQENGWSLSFARRAIAEYRRFVFLAAAAGHPVSPSDAVDQVWHLHLIYTRDYWGEFCPNVLRTSLHHGPTRGGDAESDKFADWYAHTLASYRRFFGDPPDEIWPERPAHPPARRVDLGRNWVVPRPRLWSALTSWWQRAKTVRVARRALPDVARKLATVPALVAGLFALVPHRAEAATGDALMWPFDLAGPDFLGFFVVFAVVVFGVAFTLRLLARGPDVNPMRADEPLDAYELAHLAGGKDRVFEAVLANLCNDGLITFSQREVARTDAAVPAHQPLLESVVFSAIPPGGIQPRKVRERIEHALHANATTLAERGLVFGGRALLPSLFLPLLVALVVPVTGLIKIGIGIHRDRPVVFLVMLTAAAFFGALGLFARRPHLTRRGQAVLDRARDAHTRLRGLNNAQLDSVESDAVLPLAVGLFGLGVLSGTALADVPEQLKPLPGQADGGGGWSFGGGDGGGSSCGGGGGGGGGCGGCGGGH